MPLVLTTMHSILLQLTVLLFVFLVGLGHCLRVLLVWVLSLLLPSAYIMLLSLYPPIKTLVDLLLLLGPFSYLFMVFNDIYVGIFYLHSGDIASDMTKQSKRVKKCFNKFSDVCQPVISKNNTHNIKSYGLGFAQNYIQKQIIYHYGNENVPRPFCLVPKTTIS